VKYILDTQVLIYIGCGTSERIGRKALKVYRDVESEIFISQISYWELAVKISIGKIVIPIGLKNVMILAKDAGIIMLPVDNAHILQYESLAMREDHKDPFDRFIVSVALSEKMHILGDDAKFDLYKGVKRIWN
jgi:PIN domain nuclease of toxin-antitoxin system